LLIADLDKFDMVRRHQFIFGGISGEGKHGAIGKIGHDAIL
jgi:hypothetical protein